jgi:hypothetical protein
MFVRNFLIFAADVCLYLAKTICFDMSWQVMYGPRSPGERKSNAHSDLAAYGP